MTNEELRAQLELLHAELHRTSAVDPQERELLQSLESDIRQLLDRDVSQPHHYKKLHERLNEVLAGLEASHPQITLLMRRAIDSLSYLGI